MIDRLHSAQTATLSAKLMDLGEQAELRAHSYTKQRHRTLSILFANLGVCLATGASLAWWPSTVLQVGCIGTALLGGLGTYQLVKNRSMQGGLEKPISITSEQTLLEFFLAPLMRALGLHQCQLEFILEPEITAQGHSDRMTLQIGVALFGHLNAQELACLICFALCTALGAGQHAGFRRLPNSPLDVPNRKSQAKLYALYEQALEQTCLLFTTATLRSATKKMQKMALVYTQYFKADAKRTSEDLQLLPTNLISQILSKYQAMPAQSLDLQDFEAALSECPEQLEQADTELFGHGCYAQLVSYCLLNQPDYLAQELSLAHMTLHGFTDEQLKKTHQLQAIFPSLDGQDPVKTFFQGSFRAARPLNLAFREVEIGSINNIKMELSYVAKTLRKKQNKFSQALQLLDRACVNSAESNNLTKQQCNLLEELDELNHRRLLLDLTLLLNNISAAAQKPVYLALAQLEHLNRLIPTEQALLTLLAQQRHACTHILSTKAHLLWLEFAQNCIELFEEAQQPELSNRAVDFAQQLERKGEQLQLDELASGQFLLQQVDALRWQILARLLSQALEIERRFMV